MQNRDEKANRQAGSMVTKKRSKGKLVWIDFNGKDCWETADARCPGESEQEEESIPWHLLSECEPIVAHCAQELVFQENIRDLRGISSVGLCCY